MSPLSLPLLFACFIFLAIAGQGRALTLATEPPGVLAEVETVAAMVDGRPAVAWMVADRSRVKFIRALDAEGTAWGEPVTLYTSLVHENPETGSVALRVVNGRPVVCHRRSGLPVLGYYRALDAAGAQWPAAPVEIDTGGTEVTAFSMAIVNGNPAIVFTGGEHLRYVRALDADGAAWGTVRTIVDPQTPWSGPSLQVLDGRPAVSYSSGALGVWCVRASDAAGDAWGAPVSVAPGPMTARGTTSMQVTAGVPAIAWDRGLPMAVMFSRASDAAGTAWKPAVEVAQGVQGRLAVVNGKPAAALWQPLGGNVRYSAAIDDEGSAWSQVINVESAVGVWGAPCVLEVNGLPAMVFADDRNPAHAVKYVRTRADGWPPELRVEHPENIELTSIDTLDFDNTPAGSSSPRTLILRNFNEGSADLVFHSVTIDGRDAADFKINFPPLSNTLDPNTGTIMEVAYAPLSPGVKTAVLHIASNAGDGTGTRDLVLTGRSLPLIGVRHSGGGTIARNGPFYLPSPPAGESTDCTFTIFNPGGAELNALAVTIEGGDHAEFSIAVPPAAAVPPGGSTPFTLRHTPTGAAVRKIVTLQIASNIQGEFNPFPIRIFAGAGTPDVPFASAAGIAAPVTALGVKGDGTILVATADARLTSLRPDGTPNPAFFPPGLNGGFVSSLAVLYDGKILIGGNFFGVNGVARSHLARLNADGSLDLSFDATLPGAVGVLAVQADGLILAAGGFQSPGFLVRLRPDGSRDLPFTADPNSSVSSLVFEDDGRLLLGGDFSKINGVPIQGLARLDTDGRAQPFGTVNPVSVFSIGVQADRRVIVAGYVRAEKLWRFQPDGTREALNLSGLGEDQILSVAVQADGRWLVGREKPPFSLSLDKGISRMALAGSLDQTFSSDPLFNYHSIQRVTLQADGKVLVTAFPVNMEGIFGLTPRLLRLHNDPAITTLAVEAPGILRWRRGGTAPEVTGVLFHARAEGASEWTLLGKGTRIAGGWELSGLTLPSTGHLRAVGRAGASVMETVIPVPGPAYSPLESWRVQYFQTPENTGEAADNADPDNDGLTNFTEFAFGLDPLDRASASLPSFTHNGTAFTATFTIPDGRDDVLYRAEGSPNLTAGSWTAIPDTGTGRTHILTLPATGERAFVRFAIQR